MQLREWTGQEAVKGSELVVEIFSNPVNVIMYVVWILALSLHLIHGFWSAFQSMGLNNSKWTKRIKIISHSYVTLIAASFLTTVIYFYINFLIKINEHFNPIINCIFDKYTAWDVA
ncbi:MAG: hypothetical protein LBB85_06185 [Dysgonamonadaceae bacterium]|jgi:succinate dehydrogenase / fumarate reductase cytochrome b subunit|nr:hypothetical protein [Dysgonamonadaceae bacterium]